MTLIMLRESKFLKGLIGWVTGGVSARLDVIERDVQSVEAKTERIEADQQGMANVLMAHHEQLGDHENRLKSHAAYMIQLRRMHGTLSKRLGQPFPGKVCGSCGSPLLFERVPAEKSYSLECPRQCGPRLLLPEQRLLESFGKGVDADSPLPS